jgi:hypothetical protein
MLTGVVNSRYRFVFEPFCIIYALLLLDVLWSGVASFFCKPVRKATVRAGVASPENVRGIDFQS